MDFNEIRYDVENGTATVTLNRPEKMNAMTVTMRKALIEVFGEADRDDDVRVVVVTGAGKAFCAGADLSAGGLGPVRPGRGDRAPALRAFRGR